MRGEDSHLYAVRRDLTSSGEWVWNWFAVNGSPNPTLRDVAGLTVAQNRVNGAAADLLGRRVWILVGPPYSRPNEWVWHRVPHVPSNQVLATGIPAVIDRIHFGRRRTYAFFGSTQPTSHLLVLYWDDEPAQQWLAPRWLDLHTIGSPPAGGVAVPAAIRDAHGTRTFTFSLSIPKETYKSCTGKTCRELPRPGTGHSHGKPPNGQALTGTVAPISYRYENQDNLYIFAVDVRGNLWERNFYPSRGTWLWPTLTIGHNKAGDRPAVGGAKG